MTYEFKPGEYKTRGGGSAIIFGVHEGNPIGICYGQNEGAGYSVGRWTDTGGWWGSNENHDLMPPNVERWEPLTHNKLHGAWYSSKADAMESTNNCVGVLKWTHTPDGEFVSVELEKL